MTMTFKREPAVYLNAATALLALLSAFVLHLSPGAQGAVGAVMAAIVGLWVGVATHSSWAPLALGLLKAVVLLALAFGLKLSADDQALIFSAAASLLAIFGAYSQTSTWALHNVGKVPLDSSAHPVH
jgi:hypothetical protein